MKTANFMTSSCRHCRYYQTEGRRGGICQQLGVPVRAEWKACVLAAHPFTNAWENLEKVVHLENSLALNCPLEPTETEAQEDNTLTDTQAGRAGEGLSAESHSAVHSSPSSRRVLL